MGADLFRARQPVLLLGAEWFTELPGGLNRYVRDLHGELERRGARPRALVIGPAPGAPPSVRAAGRWDEPLALRLRRFARAASELAEGAALVDAHFALYAFWPVVIGKLRGVPLVVHFQGPWAEESIAHREAALRVGIKRLVERSVYRRASEVVVLSGSFKRILVERYGITPWRISVVPPGVDLSRFTPGSKKHARRRLRIPASAWVAFTARRLVPRMGLDVLLRAWAQIVREARRDALLFIAGEGWCREDLESLAEDLGLRSSVRFLGRLSEDDLVCWYKACDVCLLPSTALEGFGLVVLEALACGAPVVVTDAGGLPEALSGLDPGLVVAAGNPSALADRLLAALDGSSPLPGADSCRRYAEGFPWDKAASRHLEIYARAHHPSKRRRLRVVYLDHSARLSGGELALLRLLSVMDEVEAHVLLAEDGPLASRLVRAGISVEVLPMAEAARGLARDRVRPGALPVRSAVACAAYTARLARRLRTLRPDLVHTNSLKAAVYGGLAARIAGVPVVWHLRDRIAPDYLPDAAIRLVRGLARRVPHAVIANSRATLATIPPVPNSHVVPSPVACGRPRGGGGSEATSRRLCAGLIGRIAPWKGQQIFLRAFALAFPDGEERAVIVGAPLFGEEAYEQELWRLADHLGLDGRVQFTGFRENVEAELSRLDILVHASVTPEPFGQVVVQGMAAGLPVIAAAAGGPAEIIEDEVTGLLYPPGDGGALAEALRRLAADPALRRRLGRRAQKTAARFSPEAIAPRVVEVYRSLLESWPC